MLGRIYSRLGIATPHKYLFSTGTVARLRKCVSILRGIANNAPGGSAGGVLPQTVMHVYEAIRRFVNTRAALDEDDGLDPVHPAAEADMQIDNDDEDHNDEDS